MTALDTFFKRLKQIKEQRLLLTYATNSELPSELSKAREMKGNCAPLIIYLLGLPPLLSRLSSLYILFLSFIAFSLSLLLSHSFIYLFLFLSFIALSLSLANSLPSSLSLLFLSLSLPLFHRFLSFSVSQNDKILYHLESTNFSNFYLKI